MPAPYNYIGQLGGVDITKAIEDSLNIRAAIAQRQAQAVLAAKVKSQALNPTKEGLRELMILNPKMAEKYQVAAESLSDQQRESFLRASGRAESAFRTKGPEAAKAALLEEKKLLENSGAPDDDIRDIENAINALETNPEMFLTENMKTRLALLGPDKYFENAKLSGEEKRAEELQPTKLTSEQAKAQKLAVDAKFAESKALGDLQEQGWRIQGLQQDAFFKKENLKIAKLNADLKREDNAIKRQLLQSKLEDAQLKRDEKVREKAAEVTNVRYDIDNALTSLAKIRKTPKSVIEAATGPVSSRLPTLSKDVADFEALIEQFNAQSFLTQVPKMKGQGNLSEGEGKKLGAAFQNMDLKQRAETILNRAEEAEQLLLKARTNIENKYGAPHTAPDIPITVDDEVANSGIFKYASP